jgi:hypothetical protein
MKAPLLTLALLIILSSLPAIVYGQQRVQPQAELTIQAVDESNAPVSGAHVRIAFIDKDTHMQAMQNGDTDANGTFVGSGYSDIKLNADLRKDGYYLSGAGVIFYDVTNGNWLPWNPTVKTIMRPVGKPVALYVRRVDVGIPRLDEPCGYDLEAGDWVAPYGKGMEKDLILTIHQEWHGLSDYDVQGELAFKSPPDGLQESTVPDIGKNSVFKWERQAPENGYELEQELRNACFPDGSGKKPVRSFKSQDVWQGYFFRVRTVEQDGKIVSAHYGKIRGGIAVFPDNTSGKPKIVFTFYYNPTPNDRNLEWDTKRNLFGNLPFDESPHEP